VRDALKIGTPVSQLEATRWTGRPDTRSRLWGPRALRVASRAPRWAAQAGCERL